MALRLLVVGAGSRGTTYARHVRELPALARVAAVAEPDPARRAAFAAEHGLPAAACFPDWRAAARAADRVDAAVVATPDDLHTAPALALLERGLHLLLEKPIAPTEAECAAIAAAATARGVVFAVCHVLRYTPYTRALTAEIAAGAIGDVVSIQRVEPVGFWHHAHSYVRGSWRNEARSSPMLLAKSCHDIDWIRHVIGARCTAVSSFGGLRHFRAEQAPAGAAERCLDCEQEATCPYSAVRIYLGRHDRGERGWPVDVLAGEGAPRAALVEALRVGPYGRCVYRCDNDVVDHQVVSMEFAGGRSASFSMVAFTPFERRSTRVFGTRGQIRGDGRGFTVHEFLTDTAREVVPDERPCAVGGAHGGGDHALVEAFLDAAARGDPAAIASGPEVSLESHRIVFAAERARRERRVVEL